MGHAIFIPIFSATVCFKTLDECDSHLQSGFHLEGFSTSKQNSGGERKKIMGKLKKKKKSPTSPSLNLLQDTSRGPRLWGNLAQDRFAMPKVYGDPTVLSSGEDGILHCSPDRFPTGEKRSGKVPLEGIPLF